MDKHAKYSPSGAHRWLTCPASLLFSDLPDTGSEAAKEGTRLHELASRRLQGIYEHISSEDEEMVSAYEEYIDRISGDIIEIEKTVYYNDEFFGTADCIIIDNNRAHVIDLKTGSVPVSAEDNEQMLCYAFMLLCEKPNLTDFTLHIAQPGNYNSADVSAEEVRVFGDRVLDVINGAKTVYCPTESACRYCKGRTSCKALHDHNMQIIAAEFPQMPKTITPDQMAKVVVHHKQIAKWMNEVVDEYTKLVLAGEVIIDEDLEISKTTTARVWKDTAADALQALNIYPYKSVMLGIGDVEKILGKNHAIFEHTEKPEGKTVLKKKKSSKIDLQLPLI